MRTTHFRNLANSLTVFRALMAIPIIISLQQEAYFLAWVTFLTASLSDLVDGYFARKAGSGSKWGARYDPLADKILTLAPMLWLCQEGIIPFWSLWLIIIRDIVISDQRSNDANGRPASLLGKIKSILLFSSLIILLMPNTFSSLDINLILRTGHILFWLSLCLSIISAISYMNSKSTYHPLKNQDH